jgi:hypothetical protein
MDVLLLILVHEFMDNRCPVSPLEWPRRITDGRLPALTNLGGSAMGRPSGVASYHCVMMLLTAAPMFQHGWHDNCQNIVKAGGVP